ncbi:MAG: hypothetical protein JW795_19900 [Chitinivibrionales bacterium]|nr:hypothetical protein [Chitinivibrionales bacterium]
MKKFPIFYFLCGFFQSRGYFFIQILQMADAYSFITILTLLYNMYAHDEKGGVAISDCGNPASQGGVAISDCGNPASQGGVILKEGTRDTVFPIAKRSH